MLAITKLLTTCGREGADMDQAEPYPDQGRPEQRSAEQHGPAQRQRRPERRRQRERVRPEELSSSRQPRPISLAHPVIAGYDGSASARNALAYAAGMARRLNRPLLMVYVSSPGVYCEPLTGQVVGLLRDADALERWLLASWTRSPTPAGWKSTSGPGAATPRGNWPRWRRSSARMPW